MHSSDSKSQMDYSLAKVMFIVRNVAVRERVWMFGAWQTVVFDCSFPTTLHRLCFLVCLPPPVTSSPLAPPPNPATEFTPTRWSAPTLKLKSWMPSCSPLPSFHLSPRRLPLPCHRCHQPRLLLDRAVPLQLWAPQQSCRMRRCWRLWRRWNLKMQRAWTPAPLMQMGMLHHGQCSVWAVTLILKNPMRKRFIWMAHCYCMANMDVCSLGKGLEWTQGRRSLQRVPHPRDAPSSSQVCESSERRSLRKITKVPQTYSQLCNAYAHAIIGELLGDP